MVYLSGGLQLVIKHLLSIDRRAVARKNPGSPPLLASLCLATLVLEVPPTPNLAYFASLTQPLKPNVTATVPLLVETWVKNLLLIISVNCL